jgi:hypothetical protein
MASTLEHQPIDPHTREFLEEAAASKFDFHTVSIKAAGDERLKTALNSALMRQYTGRQLSLLQLPDSDKLRTLAGDIKGHTLDNLDYYLVQTKQAVERNGGHVHFARTGEEAKQIIFSIIDKAGCTSCIKSKSMVSEEIELAHALEARGMDVVETDLGEFIVQIDQDKPSHLVSPIVHKDRGSIGKSFSEYFGTPYTDDPNQLTKQARIHLRDKFRRADFGMTGGNFVVAETGQVCVVENEGNARQSVTTPRVLVSLIGIEKLVPRLADLAVMLKLLARSATGQPFTVYTNLFGGPRKPGEKDGPEEFHIVLLDNGRTECLPDLPQDRRACIWQRLSRPDRRADHAALSGAWQLQGFTAGQQLVWGVLRSVPGEDQHPAAPDQYAAGHRQPAPGQLDGAGGLSHVGLGIAEHIFVYPDWKASEVRAAPPRESRLGEEDAERRRRLDTDSRYASACEEDISRAVEEKARVACTVYPSSLKSYDRPFHRS